MRVCRTRVAVRGRRRKERVLIPRYRFVSVALEFAAVGAGFEITGPGGRAAALGQALPWGRGRDVVAAVRHSLRLPLEQVLAQQST